MSNTTVNLTINNVPMSVPAGLTLIEAANRHGIAIPNLCYMPNVHEYGSCRLCVVEVEGARTLQAACVTKVQEGMKVRTNSEKVRKARRVLYELILSDHSKDCLFCNRNQNCELQQLGKTLGVESSRFEGERAACYTDVSVSITRDMSKCVLCRRCVTVCNDIQKAGILNAQNRGFSTEISPPMGLPIGSVSCSFCGQCTVVCPVGALKETDATQKVWAAIANPEIRTVVQVAPAVRVALGEACGLPPGERVTGKMVAALRRLEFDDIFDTNFAADLTIIEEGTEVLGRIEAALTGKSAVLPVITSCSPGWIKHVEHTYPDLLSHLSTCKSPHMMLGALIKSFYAKKLNVDPKNVFVVSIMPCTAKKFEVSRQGMTNDGVPNVDAVLTTRELGDMIATAGINFASLPDEGFDEPLGISSGAADIFGITGGVMEAALRTVHELVTGKPLNLRFEPVRGFEQIKEAAIPLDDVKPEYSHLKGAVLRIAVTSGLSGANRLMDMVAVGASPYHFNEVMGCPGGCIMGGGQPRSQDPDIRNKRLKALYSEDESKKLRVSHENPALKSLYADFLKDPGGHLAHELLHTHYVPRGIFNERLKD